MIASLKKIQLAILNAPTLQALQQWWQTRPVNDRRALTALAIFTLVIGSYFLLLVPAQEWADEQAVQFERQWQDQQWLAEELPSPQIIQRLQQRPSSNALSSVINRSAKQFGISFDSNRPGRNGIQLSASEVSYAAVQNWLLHLQRQHGLSPSTVRISATNTEGLVSAQITIANVDGGA